MSVTDAMVRKCKNVSILFDKKMWECRIEHDKYIIMYEENRGVVPINWYFKNKKEKKKKHFYFLFELARPPNSIKIASINPIIGSPVFCISIVFAALT